VTFRTARDLYLLSVVALIRLARSLSPHPGRLLLLKAVASTAYRVSRTKRRLSEKSVTRAFQGRLSNERIRTIVKASFYQFWLEMFSMHAPGVAADSPKRVRVRGLEHLQRTLDKGKGAILWESSHLGRRLLAKQILRDNGFPVDQVHGHNHIGGLAGGKSFLTWTRQYLIRRFFENCERPFVRGIIYVTSNGSFAYTKTLAERLRQNGIICMSADSRRGQKLIPIPFLGHTEYFPTGLVSLAMLSGATVLPIFCLEENGEGTSLIIEPPLCIRVEGSRENGSRIALAQYVSLLESYIQRYPEQYWDWHELATPASNIGVEIQ
jgi:lauroyl/myristoyl acyltransferase